MREIREGLKYSTNHRWARIEQDGTVTIGITDHGQDASGTFVHIHPPAVGTRVARNDPAGTLESSKATYDMYSPIAGEVIAVNAVLRDAPTTANSAPYDAGWFFRLLPDDLADLDEALEADDYRELLTPEED